MRWVVKSFLQNGYFYPAILSGAQIFEIVGLNKSVVDKYFTGATSRIQGMGLDEIAREALLNTTSLSVKRYSGTTVSRWWTIPMEKKGRRTFIQPTNHSFVAICYQNE